MVLKLSQTQCQVAARLQPQVGGPVINLASRTEFVCARFDRCLTDASRKFAGTSCDRLGRRRLWPNAASPLRHLNAPRPGSSRPWACISSIAAATREAVHLLISIGRGSLAIAGQIILIGLMLCCGLQSTRAASSQDTMSCAKLLIDQALHPVSYNSTEGQTLVTKCGFTPPPIRFMTFTQIEPDRRAVAKEWASPYCLKWDDGCDECTRTSEREVTRCTSISNSACQRHDIRCRNIRKIVNDHDENLEDTLINNLCSTYVSERFEENTNGMKAIFTTRAEVDWVLSKGKWSAELTYAVIPNYTDIRKELEFRRVWASGRIAVRENDVRCTETYRLRP
jgi:hypothetical protein